MKRPKPKLIRATRPRMLKEVEATVIFRATPAEERRLIKTIKKWKHSEFNGDDDFRDAVHELIASSLEREEAETFDSLTTNLSRQVPNDRLLPPVRSRKHGRNSNVTTTPRRKRTPPPRDANGVPAVPFRTQ